MNNKDREYLGYFLSNIDDDMYGTDIDILLEHISDDKLDQIVDNYKVMNTEDAKMMEDIIERSIQLWNEDCPNDIFIQYTMSNSYQTGGYMNKARELMIQEFKDNDDTLSLDIIESIQ